MRLPYLDIKSHFHFKLLFFAYLIFLLLISFVGVSFHYSTRIYGNEVSFNLLPFKTISEYLLNFQRYNLGTWLYNTLGNLLVFIPLGMLIPSIIPSIQRSSPIIVISFICSLAIETLQFITGLGVFDVDDVILNIVGGITGFIFLILIKKFFN
jgi:glycopeptide antibiotics resistance protein